MRIAAPSGMPNAFAGLPAGCEIVDSEPGCEDALLVRCNKPGALAGAFECRMRRTPLFRGAILLHGAEMLRFEPGPLFTFVHERGCRRAKPPFDLTPLTHEQWNEVRRRIRQSDPDCHKLFYGAVSAVAHDLASAGTGIATESRCAAGSPLPDFSHVPAKTAEDMARIDDAFWLAGATGEHANTLGEFKRMASAASDAITRGELSAAAQTLSDLSQRMTEWNKEQECLRTSASS